MKMPTDNKPLVRDPDLLAAIEKLLAPFEGQKLQKAQNAVRKVRASGAQGPFSTVVEAYRVAIEQATRGRDD